MRELPNGAVFLGQPLQDILTLVGILGGTLFLILKDVWLYFDEKREKGLADSEEGKRDAEGEPGR